MDSVVLNIAVADERQAEILVAGLADFPFGSFETAEGVLKAYIPQDRLPACREQVDELLARSGVAGRFETIPAQNWNAVWERDFPPVDVGGRLLIRAPFHAPASAGVAEVVVTPRMSFGTGHHATTWLMARALLDLHVAGREGLDAGSGTGVLSIVAAKCGARHVDAVDIDEWADASCRENVAANGVADRITPVLGDRQRFAGRCYDFILANINRNVLVADMPAYAAALRPGGDLLLSGFLEADVPVVVGAAAAAGLRLHTTAEREGWMLVHVRKVPGEEL